MIAIALAILPVGARGGAADLHSTPIAMLGKWAVVEVRLNGDPAPHTFIVDTAAGASVVDAGLAKQLGLGAEGQATSNIQGASGDAAQAGVGVLDKLDVAGISIAGVDVVITDMQKFGQGAFHYDGILGNDVLRRYAVTIDVPRGTMTLADADLPSGRWTACRGQRARRRSADSQAGFAAVAVNLPARSTAVAIVDSGAASTVLNWPAAQGAGISEGGAGVTSAKALTGFNAGGAPSFNATVKGLSVAGVPLAPFEARISDLEVLKGFDLENRPAIILGINVLRLRPFGIGRGAAQFCI